MKIFLNTYFDVPPYAKTAKLDGYAINIYASNVLMGEGYNGTFMADLRNQIKQLGKPVNLAMICGMFSTDTIYNKFPYIHFTRKHHRDPKNPPVNMKIPIPYSDGYLDKLDETIEFFSDELKSDSECYDLVEIITATGQNSATKETIFQPTDFPLKTTTEKESYSLAADKWIAAKYTPIKAYDTVTKTIDIFRKHFPFKIIVFPPIPGLGSVPCIDEYGNKCLPKGRPKCPPNTAENIIEYGKLFNNFRSQYSAFKDGTLTYSEYVQSNNLYHKTATLAQYEAMISHAIETGKENLEVHESEILRFPSIFTS